MNKKTRWIILAMFVALILGIGLSTSSVMATGDGDEEECGCVRTIGYWKNHPWPFIPEEEQWLAGEEITWSQVLNMPPGGSAYIILAKQYVAARLNEEAGANPDCSVCVSGHLERAEDFLAEPYSNWSEYWREANIADAQYLDDWNNGLLPGVPACPDD